MKRITLFTILMVSVLAAFAGDKMKLTEGDKAIFKEECVANVVFDDYTTIIDGKEQTADVYYRAKSEEEYTNFVNALNMGHENFIKRFNDKKKKKIKLELADSAANAAYTLKVTITRMNVGNGSAVAWGWGAKAGGTQIEGTMQLVNNATGEAVCKFEFAEIKGLKAVVFRARAVSAYRYLADELIKAVK